MKDVSEIEKLLDLMLSKKVAAFELGDLKVNFAPHAFDELADGKRESSQRDKSLVEEIDESLGFEWEE